MLNKDESFSFIKRWNELERAGRALDFSRSKWAAELRSKFAPGTIGDDQFRNWCNIEIGLGEVGASELLERASAFVDVPDERTWNTVGGFQQVRQLGVVPRSERPMLIEAAKSGNRNIRSVLRERKLIEPIEKSSPARDARELAAFIERTSTSVPKHIAKIVARYVESKQKRAA